MIVARTPLLLGVAAVAFTALGVALVSQHVFGMEPCPWCALQRLIFVAIGLAALAGLVWSTRSGTRWMALVLLGLASLGMAAALWQHFVAAAGVSCNLTLADRVLSTLQLDAWLPEIFQPRATCADAAVNLLGLPYEFWSLGLFALIEAAALALLLRAACGQR